MAYLLLPLNGVGRGHLTRALIFADWLREAGRLPMIALQGASRFAAPWSVPTTNVPTLHHAVEANAQRLADDLARAALLSSPSVIIEDTHPRRVSWPPGIGHVIVVRPTRIDHMRLLQRLHGETACLLICDHPSSPTWPYDAAQTAEIQSWPRWDCLGPVFRALSPEAVDRMRATYRLQPDEALFVFSMGGGGELEGSGDRRAFVEAAAALAGQLRARIARPRFVFVRGPLFPAAVALPAIFEDVHEEPDLPSLFALARGAVVRPGYNVTWECIAAGTPFIALRGTTKSEPVQVRLDALVASGFEISPDVGRLIDPAARARFAAACRTALARFDGAPRERFLAHTERAQPVTAPAPAEPRPPSPGAGFTAGQLDRLARAVRDAGAPMPLRIRLDDVTRLDDEVRWLIALCREHGARLSLEIVPYHNAITGAELDRLDPDGAVDIGQHGYAHLPAYRDGVEIRGEFVDGPAGDKAVEQLRIGAGLLARAFGGRFRGGYSAPYDLLPPGLASTWRAVGGRYLSWIWARPTDDALPCVRVAFDPWDWKAGKPHEGEALVERIVSRMARIGGVGLVLHPQCLRDPGPRQMTADLVRCLIGAGCVPARIDPHPDSNPDSHPA
jgi:hypothetical protein